METTRQQKIAKQIQKDVAEIFQKEGRELLCGTLATVTAVRVSPDLSVAKAYLSVFPTEKSQEMLQSITASARTVRYELAQRVRFQLRKTPELQFYLDDSLDYLENIDHLLEEK